MAKYFLSLTSTFESLLNGKLVPSDLAGGFLTFGCKREHVLLPYDLVPIEVMLNNKIKPKAQGKCSTVNRREIDADVLKVWDDFAAQIRRANLESRLIFMHDIGHPSYRRFSQETVRQGNQVFWKGEWVQLQRPAAPEVNRSADVQTVRGVPLPDETFIDEILAEASGTSSMHGYSLPDDLALPE